MMSLNKSLLIAVTVFGMLPGVPRVKGQVKNLPKARVDVLIAANNAHEIERIEIFRLPKNYENVISIRPEAIEKLWFSKMTIRELCPQREQMIGEALGLAKVNPSNRDWDLRWGIVFYSRSGDKRVAALYFDETGRYGSVDQNPVSYAAEFFPRLKNALHLSLE